MKADKINSQAKNIQRWLAKQLINPSKSRQDKLKVTNWSKSKIGKQLVQEVLDWRYGSPEEPECPHAANLSPDPYVNPRTETSYDVITTDMTPEMVEELEWEAWISERNI